MKKCPFCGNAEKLRVENTRACVGHGESEQSTYVHCPQCHCRGPAMSDWDGPVHEKLEDRKAHAIEGWNNREET